MKLSLPLALLLLLVATPSAARAADASTVVLDPIQSSLAMVFGAFSVVLALAVTIASHQRL